MSQRIIKNYTENDVIIKDLGNKTIPANGAIDLGGNESVLIELATSDDLLEVLSQGVEKFQLNDGVRDLGFSDGIDLIRKIQRPTEIDRLGRWVVRADSRKKGFETVFTGRGDSDDGKYGEGTWFKWDFSAPSSDSRWISAPEGYKAQRIEWRFVDWVLLKEGAIYSFNMPKDSYVNMFVYVRPGDYYIHKTISKTGDVTEVPKVAEETTIISRWISYLSMEGTIEVGDELNTESAMEKPTPDSAIWAADFYVPEVENWEQAHGHWTLEIYRYKSVN